MKMHQEVIDYILDDISAMPPAAPVAGTSNFGEPGYFPDQPVINHSPVDPANAGGRVIQPYLAIGIAGGRFTQPNQFGAQAPTAAVFLTRMAGRAPAAIYPICYEMGIFTTPRVIETADHSQELLVLPRRDRANLSTTMGSCADASLFTTRAIQQAFPRINVCISVPVVRVSRPISGVVQFHDFAIVRDSSAHILDASPKGLFIMPSVDGIPSTMSGLVGATDNFIFRSTHTRMSDSTAIDCYDSVLTNRRLAAAGMYEPTLWRRMFTYRVIVTPPPTLGVSFTIQAPML